MTRDIQELNDIARQIRRDVVTTIHKAGDGHPGPSLSCVDIVTALYFAVMKVDPKNPHWPDRDRFILSKGHACPTLYAVLARKGYFSPDLLPTLRSLGSILQGHPDMNKTPGVDTTSGSLGNGMSIGLGMLLAGRAQKHDFRVYVVTGDGELEEGIIWEAAMAAKRYQAGRLTVFIDNNGMQSGGAIEKVSGIAPVLPKWEAFGWHCQEIDGHDMAQILAAVDKAAAVTDAPSVILSHTVKGKGIPFMEHNNAWHKGVPNKDQLAEALAALGGEI
jgi:transketolase